MNWHYPGGLPVVARRDDILDALRHHDVVVVVSETGSGKTTQLPKMVAEVLREIYAEKMGLVGVTQPRRIAAVSVARRVAEELQVPLGGLVGYQVRFEEKLTPATRIKFMTDGILLAETQGDRLLKKYDAIILDEAHERSLNIDFLLGYLKELRKKRPRLKIVVSSATLDAGAFADFFHEEGEHVPIIEAEGRTYPVEELFLPPDREEELSTGFRRRILRVMCWFFCPAKKRSVNVRMPWKVDVIFAPRYCRCSRGSAWQINRGFLCRVVCDG